MTLHYHGTPLTPRAKLLDLAGRCFCVPFSDGRDVEVCHEIGQSVMLDNGAFSFWKTGKPTDWDAYYRWVEPWLDHHTTWAIIPDVIDGDEEDNNRLVHAWPHANRGAPVWHMHESIDRLLRLCNQWPRVCIGSSGEYAVVGSPSWRRRMDEAFNALCPTGPPPVWLHMLRGMALAGSDYPFASVDSTNLARNHKGSWRQRPRDVQSHADLLDSRQCPARWVQRHHAPELFDFCPDCGGSGTVECGASHPGSCASDPCHGHCEIPCGTCTSEGLVERIDVAM